MSTRVIMNHKLKKKRSLGCEFGFKKYTSVCHSWENTVALYTLNDLHLMKHILIFHNSLVLVVISAEE